MNILLIEDRPEEKQNIVHILKEELLAELTVASSLQEGIEISENTENQFKMVVCDYHGPSTALIRCLLSIRPDIPYLIITDSPSSVDIMTKKRAMTAVEIVNRSRSPNDLSTAIENLKKRSGLTTLKIKDSEFIRVALDSLKILRPLSTDVYIRISENKYLKIYRRDDICEEKDLQRFLNKTKGSSFYIKTEDSKHFLTKQFEKVDSALKSDNNGEAREVVETQAQVIHEVVAKIGVTPQVQELAKKTVALTLKILGNNPKLSSILKRIRQEQGRYISGHSILLAEMSCALACKMDWNSPGTFLKLSLAAFLHDLPLKDDSLARIQTRSELELRSDLNAVEIQELKLHPIKAAEYAKQFREIPPDVDTILLEHHERPDGTGFPRGLHHQQISPLSALFIIAHEIVIYFLSEGKAGDMKTFLLNREEMYSQGMFKKIFQALQRDHLAKKQ